MGPIDYRDSRPIYEQIKDSIRRLIFSGAMSEGDQLPSVRNLAAQLSINPNTIQRAYRELCPPFWRIVHGGREELEVFWKKDGGAAQHE